MVDSRLVAEFHLPVSRVLDVYPVQPAGVRLPDEKGVNLVAIAPFVILPAIGRLGSPNGIDTL